MHDDKSKAIFLDRDGVINFYKSDYVRSPNEFRIIPKTGICIKELREKLGYKIIIITNQSAIGRGILDENTLITIHNKLHNYLKRFGTKVDGIYVCPHKPDQNCPCRKPKAGLIRSAMNKHKINPSLSWMIGDTDGDVKAGRLVGCKTLKIGRDKGLESVVNTLTL